MTRLLKEPLVHFLALGGLLFGAYTWLNHDKDAERRVVRITAAEVAWLKETWARQWNRAPSDEECRDLITDYLREQLLAREAAELGLDDNDTVVRRRLAQKMEFLVQDTARLAEPDDDDLRRVYDANRGEYLHPSRITFSQSCFRTDAGARQGLTALASGSTEQLGDLVLLDREYVAVDEQSVASIFGKTFCEQAFGLEPGSWQGPIESGYGFHLIKVDERQLGARQSLDEVREQVVEAWRREQEARANELLLAELLKKYDIVVDDSVKPLMGPSYEGTR